MFNDKKARQAIEELAGMMNRKVKWDGRTLIQNKRGRPKKTV